MPNWSEILQEVQRNPSGVDQIRRGYLKRLSDITGRNTIAYYSGFLQKANIDASISDIDKNGFMTVINKLDRKKGLDIILHTPGGDLAATESIVEYLYQMFGNNIRAIVPQLAMSAGTMIACSCKSIVLEKHSSIGPIDPQFRGLPASGVIEEFEMAKQEIANNPSSIPLWQVIISKYHPTFLGECEKAIEWSKEIVTNWLQRNMLQNDKYRTKHAKKIVELLSDHNATKTHARHIGVNDCIKYGLAIEQLEDDENFQDAVLSVHHVYMITFAMTNAIKIIENQNSVAMIITANTPQIPQQVMMPQQRLPF